jgi:hypothetical protein
LARAVRHSHFTPALRRATPLESNAALAGPDAQPIRPTATRAHRFSSGRREQRIAPVKFKNLTGLDRVGEHKRLGSSISKRHPGGPSVLPLART